MQINDIKNTLDRANKLYELLNKNAHASVKLSLVDLPTKMVLIQANSEIEINIKFDDAYDDARRDLFESIYTQIKEFLESEKYIILKEFESL